MDIGFQLWVGEVCVHGVRLDGDFVVWDEAYGTSWDEILRWRSE